ncbi:MAG: GNAT family N-acetyltransferase [Acidobacteria bacterium]|nr:GNAT family N-acetyltransferase [Acidobacteriota bacterium]
MRQSVHAAAATASPSQDQATEPRAVALHAPDQIVFVPLDSSEVRRVATATGETFAAWQQYWNGLALDERDALTDPAWLAGHLAGQLAVSPPDAFVMIVLANGEPHTIAPVTHRGGGRLRHSHGYPSQSWSVAEGHQEAALNALFRSRIGDSRVRSLHLGRIEEDHPLRVTEGAVSSPVSFRSLIQFPDGYEALLKSMSPSARKGVRRLGRRLGANHDVEMDAVTAGVEMESAFNRYLQVDDRSWKRNDGSVLRSDVAQREALRTSMRHCARNGRSVAHFLRVDGQDVAAQLCVVIDNELHLVKTSYDEDWANFGVGKLLLAETIRVWCAENDVPAVNMVTGLPWHLQWEPRQITTHALWLFSPGLRGLAARCLDMPRREQAKALVRRTGMEPLARRLLRPEAE